MEKHTIEPVYDKDSKILILGSFPSIKSREMGFYYAHPQNRFWKVLASVFHDSFEDTIESKKAFLKRHHIALFDVCASCDIEGSSDATIMHVVPNDLSDILNAAKIRQVFVNGSTAYQLYSKLIQNKTKLEAILLPSTSPANARWKLEDLISAYQVLSKYE